MTTSHPLADRLLRGNFSRDACLAAIRGEFIPQTLGHPLHQKCLIRGIRYHSGFAGEVYDLLPIFTRALNARMIMDDKIPESLVHKPYCIWHPVTASEDTYRQLAHRHPDMRYSVGRACAVAGYLTLYQELDLLPDVHIAEEARECGHLEIYQLIVSRLVRYSIMNDYERSIDETNLKPENLNGDTAVRWMLDVKQEFKDSADYDSEKQSYKTYLEVGYKELAFDITEDMMIDEFSSGKEHELSTRLEIRLLSQPLPIDLPTVQKDMLILMAAYLGDIDRYVRLRRPKMHPLEKRCCIRGIYHSTFFAVWWSKQDPDYDLSAAINARMIMNNVLAGAPYEHIPYLIWWPKTAHQSTYRELARLQPRMMHQIVHACIYAGYRDLFDELLPRISPEPALEIEADYQKDPYYRMALLSCRQANQDPLGWSWKTRIREVMQASSTCVGKYLTPSIFGYMLDGAYNGTYCDASDVELAACLPDDWHVPAEATSFISRDLDYKQWPYGPEVITDPWT